MSLETLLQENTTALNEHTQAVKELIAALQASSKAVLSGPINPKLNLTDKERAALKEAGESPMKTVKQAEEPAATKPEPQPEAPAAATVIADALDAAGDASAVTYDEVKDLVLEVSTKTSADAARAILQRHGVERISKLAESQYTSVATMARKTLAGELDPLAAAAESLE